MSQDLLLALSGTTRSRQSERALSGPVKDLGKDLFVFDFRTNIVTTNNDPYEGCLLMGGCAAPAVSESSSHEKTPFIRIIVSSNYVRPEIKNKETLTAREVFDFRTNIVTTNNDPYEGCLLMGGCAAPAVSE
jgi:hypothetical protein